MTSPAGLPAAVVCESRVSISGAIAGNDARPRTAPKTAPTLAPKRTRSANGAGSMGSTSSSSTTSNAATATCSATGCGTSLGIGSAGAGGIAGSARTGSDAGGGAGGAIASPPDHALSTSSTVVPCAAARAAADRSTRWSGAPPRISPIVASRESDIGGDVSGLSLERRCGMATAAVFLARPADEGVPAAARQGSETPRRDADDRQEHTRLFHRQTASQQVAETDRRAVDDPEARIGGFRPDAALSPASRPT